MAHQVGDYALAGEYGTEDYDYGNIERIDGALAEINWQGCAIGQRTWHPISDLEPYDGEKWQRHCTEFEVRSKNARQAGEGLTG